MRYHRTDSHRKSSPTKFLSTGVVFLSLSGFFGYKLVVTWKHTRPLPQHISCTFEQVYSRHVREELERTIKYVMTSTNKATDVFSDLDEFCASHLLLKNVRLTTHSPEAVEVVLVGREPLCRINDELFLDEDGCLHAENEFEEYNQNLTNMHVPLPFLESHSDELVRISNSLSENLRESFNISYRDFYDVLLKPKNTLCHYSLVVDEKSLGEDYKISVACALMNESKLHSQTKKKKCRGRIADIRFKDRIYARVTGKERGKVHD